MMPSELDKIISLYMNNEANAWNPDYEFGRQLGCPIISQAAPGLMNEPDNNTFLWRYYFRAMRAKYGVAWEYHCQFQKQGTCGGQAGKNGWDWGTGSMCALYNQVFPGRASVAGMYAGSRVEIGNQPGRWQGTYGGWIAKMCAQFGAVLLKNIGCPENYYEPNGMDKDEQFAMAWAASREGVPSQFEDHSFPIGGLAQPRNAREVGKIIQTGVPCIVGCDLIPTGRRDANGFSHVQRGGGHLTTFVGVRYNPFGLLYLNSWGDEWAQGPVFPNDQPLGTVWINEDESNSQISQDDTWAIGNTKNLLDKYKPAFINAG